MVRALANHRCCDEIKPPNQMSNHLECSAKGPKMILGSNLNTYLNVEEFIENKKCRACKQYYYDRMANSGVTPVPNAELDIPITQNDASTEN